MISVPQPPLDASRLNPRLRILRSCWELSLDTFSTLPEMRSTLPFGTFPAASPHHQRVYRGLAGLPALVGLDHQPQMRDPIRRHRPFLPLAGRPLRAEVVLLTHHFPVVLPAVGRDGKLEFLGAGNLRFLNLQGHTADCPWSVEGEYHHLLARFARNSSGSAWSPVAVEGMVDRMLNVFGSHQHGGDSSDFDLPRHGLRVRLGALIICLRSMVSPPVAGGRF